MTTSSLLSLIIDKNVKASANNIHPDFLGLHCTERCVGWGEKGRFFLPKNYPPIPLPVIIRFKVCYLNIFHLVLYLKVFDFLKSIFYGEPL